MIDLKAYLYGKVRPIIMQWNEEGIYAISFFVYSNEANKYKQYSNVSEFGISYNTLKDCENASDYAERRWNYAFWRQNVHRIIDPYDSNSECLETLFQWYSENGIEDIGFEDYDNEYDETMHYIGKGPIGYYELLTVISEVARQLQVEGIISEKFGKIPIIVHDLEYPWFIEEATARANPNGEADVFLEALKRGFE